MFVASKGCGFDSSFDISLASIAAMFATREGDRTQFKESNVMLSMVFDPYKSLEFLAFAQPSVAVRGHGAPSRTKERMASTICSSVGLMFTEDKHVRQT